MTLLSRIASLLLAGSLLTTLGGCATREKLAYADTAEQITLPKQLEYKTTAIAGNKWEYIALAGTYDAERRDSDGIYFYGPGRSIVEIGELYGNVPRLKIGGFYLPNDQSKPVQIVFAFENTPVTTNDLGQYIQERTIATTATPALRPGVGVGTNIAGNIVAGGIIALILEAGEGEISRLTIKDKATSDIVRSARGPKSAMSAVERQATAQ